MIQKNIRISNKCCIGCIPAYTYGNYVYFNNIIDAPKEYNNNLTFNQKPHFNITSLSKLMDDTFTSSPKRFVDEMKKKWMNSHIKVVD